MANLTPKIAVIGYCAVDINILGKSRTVLPGGAAYFVSIFASRFLKPIGLVTRIGKDYFNKRFLFKRVLKSGLKIIDNKRTFTSTQIYLSKDDLTQRDILLDWGVGPDINPADIPADWLKTVKNFHIATMPPQQQKEFISFIRKNVKDAYISIDTDLIWLKKNSTAGTVRSNFLNSDLVFANRREYKLLEKTIDSVKEAVVKYDKDGAVYMHKGKIIQRVSAPEVRAVDVTGAGDILAGTFLAMRLKSGSVSKSLAKSVDVATEAIAKEGVEHLF